MFGYVEPLKPELKIKDYACFRSYYCGVCKALGKRYSSFCRFTVTYDAAFLALLNSSLGACNEIICFEKCIVNPFRRKPVVKESWAVDYAAMINVLLAYFKLMDNWRDDKNIFALLASGLIRQFNKKVRDENPEVYRAVHEQLDRLRLIELEGVCSIDHASDPFGKLLSLLLSWPQRQKTSRRVLEWMGYNLGKWIYLLDAYSDLENDIKSNCYNVLVLKYGKDLSPSRIKQSSRQEIEFVLGTCLVEIGKAYELLDIKHNAELLENIIYLGLVHKTKRVLNEEEERDGSVQGSGCQTQRYTAGNQKSL
ncbi:MAG: hypothetical protein GX094_08740 [Clostridiales bacterium]|jgi:hypothetical protein|nr:hypothetical protein [Clostridiales bacterium]